MAKQESEALKAKGEKLFIHLNYSLKDIAEELDKTQKTIGKWAEEGKWKEKKAAEESGPERLCAMLLMQNLAIAEKVKEDERLMTPAEADMIHKNASTIAKFKKDVNLLSASAVFKKYNNWLVEINQEQAKANTEYQRKFLTILASE